MAQVHISNIKKSYGAVVALHDISLEIPSGSFFTLLGPSGCGKTTLLRTIAGFHRQDSGSIAVDGEVLDQTPVHLRDIGMVFQDYAIFPHLSVAKNVAFGLRQRKVPKRETNDRLDEILQIVQLEKFADRMPHELSGGQQQRVGLARALVTNPKVLLMDEPLSNLDAQLRVDLRRELRTIQQKLGITTIYVTHDQEEALEMSDFVCVMHKGVIQHSGTPWTIYHEPNNRFVASFVGSNNFVPLIFAEGRPEICGIPFESQEHLNAIGSTSEVMVSIRPEHIILRRPADPAVADGTYIEIPVTLQYQGFAGRELRLTTQASSGETLQVISEPHPELIQLQQGAHISLHIRKDALNFFHPGETGLRL